MNRKYHEAMGWIAIIRVLYSGVTANNMGAATDPKKTSEAEWKRLKQCLGQFAPNADLSSVRGQWMKFCNGKNMIECMISGGAQRLEQLALKHGCGNCTEKTAVALMFLEQIGVRKLDFMELNTHTNNIVDHAFVVIGRERGSVDMNPKTWGPEAVICDPWHDHGKVYPASEIETKVFRGHHGYDGPIMPNSIFRLE